MTENERLIDIARNPSHYNVDDYGNPTPKTNFEVWRNKMTITEVAELVKYGENNCGFCPVIKYCQTKIQPTTENDCAKAFIKWAKMKVGETA